MKSALRILAAACVVCLVGGAYATQAEDSAQGVAPRSARETSVESAARELTTPGGISEAGSLETPTRLDRPLLGGSNPFTADSCSGTNRVGFGGYFWECPLKLYFTPSGRLYDPELGRFLQQDTHLGDIANVPSLHRYTFGHNNPTSFIDPTGHESYRQWILLDKPSSSLGHEFLKNFGYNAFNALSFGALGRQDTLVEQSEAGHITEGQYVARTGINTVGSATAAVATIYTAGAAGTGTAGALAPLTAATEVGAPLVPAAVAPIAAGAAAGGTGALAGSALSDDVGMLTGTVDPRDVHPSNYIAPTVMGTVTGGLLGAASAPSLRQSQAVLIGEGDGSGHPQFLPTAGPMPGPEPPVAGELHPNAPQLQPGRTPLRQFDIDRYSTFSTSTRVGDQLAGHEMLQNGWLRAHGYAGQRGVGTASRSNPAVALDQDLHMRVGIEQARLGLNDTARLRGMDAAQNIELNAMAMRRAGVPEPVIRTLQREALAHAAALSK